MIISDVAIRAIEEGQPTWTFSIAVKREVLDGREILFIGFDDIDAWGAILKTAHPEMRQNITEAIKRYLELVNGEK